MEMAMQIHAGSPARAHRDQRHHPETVLRRVDLVDDEEDADERAGGPEQIEAARAQFKDGERGGGAQGSGGRERVGGGDEAAGVSSQEHVEAGLDLADAVVDEETAPVFGRR
jgi:hypothetical protein